MQCLRDVPLDNLDEANITRASGGVEPLSSKAAPREGRGQKGETGIPPHS